MFPATMDVAKLLRMISQPVKKLAGLFIDKAGIRLAIVNTVLRDVATKNGIEKPMREISLLEKCINGLKESLKT